MITLGWLRSRSTMPRTSRHPRRAVPIVVAQTGVVGVALDVGLVDHVHPDLVAQVEEARIVGIVRAAHRGDVVPAHRQQVGAHVVHRHGLAAGRMVVVAVDAEDPDRLPVDEELAITHLDGPEPDQLAVRLDDRSVGIEQLGADPVPGR